ncbi:pickpocket protein 19-like [Maniola jurtina]|uniref:pickpocket protein 19-like n=1 Tax=Maniola jurtina TaxID=191418 RepID=UPI001E68C89D|nr:pickpocket protein 19-like [Maniola jurtina]
MRELLTNCSMEGVRFIADIRNPRFIRWSYFVLVLGSLAGGLVVAGLNLATVSSRPPLVVVTQVAPHPVQQVDFPAVALCSYNTISAAELDSYAKYLYSLEKNNTYSLEDLKRNLLAFSGLITTYSQVSFDANFTKYLAEVVRQTNVTDIIYRLSPKCESMFVRCGWRGGRASCNRLFALRITDVGYCCVFNSRYSSEDRKNHPYRVKQVGQEYGLSVIVKENTDDFTYVRRSGEELEMLIFDGRQYPLNRAGVIRTYPVRRNASVFVTLQASVQRASGSLRYMTEAWRGCALTYPEGLPRHSWSQCVAECRRRAALALCQCTPHTKPISNRSSNEVTCSLEHLACLDKHKEKLTFFYPGENAHESLSEEQADSVECLHCRPNCARLRYAAKIWTMPYKNIVRKILYNHFVQDVKLWNATVLRIYFTTNDQHLCLVETNMRIFEVLSFISCQWVLVVGATVVTVLEVLYHCTVRWRHHYARRRRQETLPRVKEAKRKKIKKKN